MAPSVDPQSRSRLWHVFTALLPYAALIFIFAGMGLRDAVRANQYHLPVIFWTMSNLGPMAIDCALTIVAAAGMTLVILTGGIDLSVGSIIGVASAVACLATNYFQNCALGMALGVVVGMLCGLLNGALVIGLRVQPFIVTLGALMSLRGVCRLLNNNSYISIGDGLKDPKAALALMARFKWLSGKIPGVDLPWFLVVAIAVVALLWVVLNSTRLGRRLYAVGSNEEAARLSGVRVQRTKILAYTIAGTTAGLAGVMNATRLGGSSAQTGETTELTIIAAVVIGGTSLSGGQGTVMGCVIGAILMVALSGSCTSLRIDDAWQKVIIGMFLIGAAAVDRLRRGKANA